MIAEEFESVWEKRKERIIAFHREGGERAKILGLKRIEEEEEEWKVIWGEVFLMEGGQKMGELSGGQWSVDDYWMEDEDDDDFDDYDNDVNDDNDDKIVTILSKDLQNIPIQLFHLKKLNIWYRNYMFTSKSLVNSDVIRIECDCEVIRDILYYLSNGSLKKNVRNLKDIIQNSLIYNFRDLRFEAVKYLYENIEGIEDKTLLDILFIEEDLIKVKARVGRELVRRGGELGEEVWKVIEINVRGCIK
ncbi:hypothetical protein TrLO_g10484 [Triparma laevis f. longispina]|uniref:BTB domain-containing protein n=1 Tax=Triparma laevis f. longispina TaxID=1714387 RepID=A0A9W7KU08_9STRA|nr:hypothetical protein TrLO_g10484 [Triparma laevis f. longispina]